jgi:tRNA(Ile2)-agmatinylcytidine synthase
MVRPLEPIERWVIFRTNQGTDAHLQRVSSLDQLRPYSSVIARGTVAANPTLIPRRHVIFPVRDERAQADCAAYEPTGILRREASKLIEGDYVEAYGGVRVRPQQMTLTINLEKIRLLKLAPKIAYQNPKCPKCGKRMKSMGKNKGFRCKKCGIGDTSAKKTRINEKRKISPGLYITSTRSQRHLTKPSIRYGMEKHQGQIEKLIEEWHFP